MKKLALPLDALRSSSAALCTPHPIIPCAITRTPRTSEFTDTPSPVVVVPPPVAFAARASRIYCEVSSNRRNSIGRVAPCVASSCSRFAADAMLSLVPASTRTAGVVLGRPRLDVAPPPLRAEVRLRAPSPSTRLDHRPLGLARPSAPSGSRPLTRRRRPPRHRSVQARWINETASGSSSRATGREPAHDPDLRLRPDPGPRAGAGEVVQIRRRPQPIVEVRPAAPFGGAVVPRLTRHWNGNRHMWVGGHWSAALAPARSWEPNHWQHTPRGWVHVRGHWRRG